MFHLIGPHVGRFLICFHVNQDFWTGINPKDDIFYSFTLGMVKPRLSAVKWFYLHVPSRWWRRTGSQVSWPTTQTFTTTPHWNLKTPLQLITQVSHFCLSSSSNWTNGQCDHEISPIWEESLTYDKRWSRAHCPWSNWKAPCCQTTWLETQTTQAASPVG